jgi:hydrogenase expression/formation protein HypC
MCLAVPGQIVVIHGDDPLSRVGLVSFGGAMKDIHLACTPEAEVHDYVLVHAGLAIAVIDQMEASRLQDALRSLGEEPE